jgi:quercetin dioxygenase-like cupin family protein
MMNPTVDPWPSHDPPSQAEIEALMRQEGLSPRAWSNGPGDVYASHDHPYTKVLYCVRGSIRFSIDDSGQHIDLSPGDRLVLPPATRHSAVVGPQGVLCVEAPKPEGQA